MNYTNDKLGLTIRQFESKVRKGIYTKSLILKMLIQCNASAVLIHKALVQYFYCEIGLKTVYKYLNELVICGLVRKHQSLTDTRIKIYSLKEGL